MNRINTYTFFVLKIDLITALTCRIRMWLIFMFASIVYFSCWVILQIAAYSGPTCEVVQNSKLQWIAFKVQVDTRLWPMLATFFGWPHLKESLSLRAHVNQQAGPTLANAGPLWAVVWLRHRAQSTVLWPFWWRYFSKM